MNEQELDLQIKEGEVAIAKAEESIAKGEVLYKRLGIDDDFFDKLFASNNFSKEFKDKIKDSVSQFAAELDAHGHKHVQGKSSNIAARKGVTKI